jgi:hypothetical protein
MTADPVRARLLEGPIAAPKLRLAWPVLVVLALQTFVGVAETYFVSSLGADAVAGVALVFPIIMLMTMMSNGGIGGGVSSAVARATGAGRKRDAEALATHAALLGTLSIYWLSPPPSPGRCGRWEVGGGTRILAIRIATRSPGSLILASSPTHSGLPLPDAFGAAGARSCGGGSHLSGQTTAGSIPQTNSCHFVERSRCRVRDARDVVTHVVLH